MNGTGSPERPGRLQGTVLRVFLSDDQEAGIKIVLRALGQPMREIVANAGEEPSVVVNKVTEGKGNWPITTDPASAGFVLGATAWLTPLFPA